jgi:hypothetical protein
VTIPPFTIAVACDREHLAELANSFPTWMRCPILRERPILVGLHPEINCSDVYQIIDYRRHKVSCTFVRPQDGWSQREVMLSWFVLDMPHHVTTSHYLKIDCDSLFLGGDWIERNWFIADPVLIAPSWNYSKPNDTYDRLDSWAATVPSLARREPPHRVKHHDRVKSPRIISYVMFGRTEWTRQVAQWCGDRMPVPSQDGLLGYAAERGGFHYVRTRMPQWRHIGRGGEKLAVAAREAMTQV